MEKTKNEIHAKICELYIGAGMQINEIAKYLKVKNHHVADAIERYLKRPNNPVIISVDSIINNRTAYVLSQWDKQSTKDIADDLGCNPDTVWSICRRVGINTKKRVLSIGTNYPQIETAVILNNETGTFHFSEAEAARAYSISRRTLNDYFNGVVKSKRFHRFQRFELN